MRTTITLEPDVVDLLDRVIAMEGVTFKDAVNDAIRRGLRPHVPVEEYRVPVRDLGVPLVPLTKSLALAADLEDDEIVRKLAVGR